MARTQQERREQTVGRLLEACIATIIEVGYAKASAAVITKRAGVSVGALFRHFETMGDFMAATASEVLRRQLDSFTKRVAEIPADQPALQAVLAILRDITSGPTNAVFYELLIAARTDEKLRDTIAMTSSGSTPRRSTTPRGRCPAPRASRRKPSPVVVALMTNVFDGAAVVEGVLPQPDIAEQRIPVLTALLSAAVPNAGL